VFPEVVRGGLTSTRGVLEVADRGIAALAEIATLGSRRMVMITAQPSRLSRGRPDGFGLSADVTGSAEGGSRTIHIFRERAEGATSKTDRATCRAIEARPAGPDVKPSSVARRILAAQQVSVLHPPSVAHFSKYGPVFDMSEMSTRYYFKIHNSEQGARHPKSDPPSGRPNSDGRSPDRPSPNALSHPSLTPHHVTLCHLRPYHFLTRHHLTARHSDPGSDLRL